MKQANETKPASLRSILLVDDDARQRARLAASLRKEIGCVVVEASSSQEALDLQGQNGFSLLLTSLFSPAGAGLELLQQTRELHPQTVILTAVPAGDRGAVTESLERGAYMYINKPYDPQEAVIVASRGLQFFDLQDQGCRQRATRVRKHEGFHGIIGRSHPMQNLFDFIEKVAEDDLSTVLIQGESGTGKELVAQVIHALSPRREHSLVPVNCAAIPDELLESELFGYVKGAFTGATQSKMGRIQYADGGTLFLDEIGDMKPILQAKLLRVLQEKEFEPVGGLKPIPVNVRVIAATHRDLEQLVAEGAFREDLYYRLSVIPLTIPPLRERTDDIPLLIDKFVQIFNRGRKKPLKGFRREAMAALLGCPWRGNVRELENLVQHMTILHAGRDVGLDDLPVKYRAHYREEESGETEAKAAASRNPEMAVPETAWQQGEVDFNVLINEFESRLIVRALAMTGGNKKEAARMLNLKRTTLIEKIKKKEIDLDEIMPPAADAP